LRNLIDLRPHCFSVRNDPNGFSGHLECARFQYEASHGIGASNPYRLFPTQGVQPDVAGSGLAVVDRNEQAECLGWYDLRVEVEVASK